MLKVSGMMVEPEMVGSPCTTIHCFVSVMIFVSAVIFVSAMIFVSAVIFC